MPRPIYLRTAFNANGEIAAHGANHMAQGTTAHLYFGNAALDPAMPQPPPAIPGIPIVYGQAQKPLVADLRGTSSTLHNSFVFVSPVNAANFETDPGGRRLYYLVGGGGTVLECAHSDPVREPYRKRCPVAAQFR